MKNNIKRKGTAALAVFVATGIMFSGCAAKGTQGTSAQPETTSQTQTEQSADADLKNDYYAAVNSDLLKEHDVEKTGESWNWFYDLLEKSESEQTEIVKAAASEVKSGKVQEGTPEYRIGSLYLLASDTDGRNKAGVTAFNEMMKPVMDAETAQELLEQLARLQYHYGFKSIINVDVLALDETPGQYTAQISPMSSEKFISSTDFEDSEGEEEAKGYFTGYLAKIMTGAGYTEKEAQNKVNAVYSLVSGIAKKDNAGKYELVRVNELDKMLENIDLRKILSVYFKTMPQKMNIRGTEWLNVLSSELTEDNLQALKDYAYMINLDQFGRYLGEDMTKAISEAQQEYIGDDEEDDQGRTPEKQVASLLSWDVGKLYTERSYTQDEAAAVNGMVSELLSEYKTMLSEEEWLSKETRERTIKKLEAINIRIGMPEDIERYLSTWEPVSAGKGGSYFSNACLIIKEKSEKKYDNYGTDVDRTVWQTLPQEMTPCYYPTDNSIYIPVASLEEPYFALSQTEEENLGAIGTIIGHEITHAFDDLGSKYNEKGDPEDWWTEADKQAFNERTRQIIDYYNNYKTPGEIQTDGEMTLGENIADLGSMSCLTRIVERKGLSSEKFFEAFARSWASTADMFSQSIMAGMDEHASDKVRVNAVLSSTDLFYRTYGIKEGDGMFIKSEKRAGLW